MSLSSCDFTEFNITFSILRFLDYETKFYVVQVLKTCLSFSRGKNKKKTNEHTRGRRKCLLERKDPHLEIDETEFYEKVFYSA